MVATTKHTIYCTICMILNSTNNLSLEWNSKYEHRSSEKMLVFQSDNWVNKAKIWNLSRPGKAIKKTWKRCDKVILKIVAPDRGRKRVGSTLFLSLHLSLSPPLPVPQFLTRISFTQFLIFIRNCQKRGWRQDGWPTSFLARVMMRLPRSHQVVK